MKINVTSLKIRRVSNRCFELAMTSEKHPQSTSYYLTKSELPLMRQCLEGVSEFYPFFSDVSYLVQPHPQGFHCYEISGKEAREYWFTLPVQEMFGVLDELEETFDIDNDKLDWIADLTEEIPFWAKKYAPIVEIVYHGTEEDGSDTKERLQQDINNPLVENPEYAQNFLPTRIHALEQYSDGNVVQLHIWFDNTPQDGIPTGYYWEMRNTDGSRIMNGGFLPHKREKDGKVTYQYGVHT